MIRTPVAGPGAPSSGRSGMMATMVEPVDEGGEAPCYAHLLGEECGADGDPPAAAPDDEGE